MKKRLSLLLAVLWLLVSLTVPAFATASEYYVYDEAGLLTYDEVAVLEQQCAEAAELYGSAIYIVTVDDCYDYGSSPRNSAENIYIAMDFGAGENKNGIMLMLSMDDRDFSMIAYGDIANNAYTDYVQAKIEEKFLDDFRNDDWYGGFSDFVSYSTKYLSEYDPSKGGNAFGGYYKDGVYYEDPSYYDYDMPLEERLYYLSSVHWTVIIGAPCIIALTICLIMKSRMKTARIATEAGEYIPAGGVKITKRRDQYLHTTVQVIHHERDDDNDSFGGGFSGGTSVSSGGFSGRSGKF